MEKKLEEKFKKVREHNAKTGSDKKECEFEDELAEFFRSDPKIIPPILNFPKFEIFDRSLTPVQ